MWAKGRSWVTVRLCPFFFVQPNLDAIQAMDIGGITNLRELFSKPWCAFDTEIGFGMGTSLVEMAKMTQHETLSALKCMRQDWVIVHFWQELGLNNLKLISGDAIALMQQLPAAHIDTLQLYFPDPWQKKPLQTPFCQCWSCMRVVERVLKKAAYFMPATDWGNIMPTGWLKSWIVYPRLKMSKAKQRRYR